MLFGGRPHDQRSGGCAARPREEAQTHSGCDSVATKGSRRQSRSKPSCPFVGQRLLSGRKRFHVRAELLSRVRLNDSRIRPCSPLAPAPRHNRGRLADLVRLMPSIRWLMPARSTLRLGEFCNTIPIRSGHREYCWSSASKSPLDSLPFANQPLLNS